MSEKNRRRADSASKRTRMYNLVKYALDSFVSKVDDGEPVSRNRKQRQNGSPSDFILEEEVLYCKNNVCVHSLSDSEKKEEIHVPGYMSIKKIYKADNEISDLILSWVPNKLLTVGSMEEGEVEENESGINLSVSSEFQNSEDLERSIDSEGKITKDQLKPLDLSKNASSSQEDDSDFQYGQGMSTPSSNSSFSPTKDASFKTPFGDVFTVNLSDMKALKLFYADKSNDSGHFVVGSHENQYKVFHFHCTGMEKLTEIFDGWTGCLIDAELDIDDETQKVYHISGGARSVGEDGKELHPEENRYRPMNTTIWQSCINQLGQIEDVNNFRKHVFFAGLSQEVRPDAWKYLLYYYPMHSTSSQREQIKVEKAAEYEKIHQQRLALCGEDYEIFWKKVQFTVDKDVVRTDRSNPYYAGQDNPNVQKMRNILLNYAIYNPTMGYTQGMSDLLAPLLATMHNEAAAFWSFVGLMDFSMFATTPTDDSMDTSLGYLRDLLRMMLPEFYIYCLCQDYDMNLLFCHRWLVLCFKREFITPEVMKIWEACWSRYQTDYFHIFVCTAILSLYGQTCITKKMGADDMLQYFTDMALKFDGSAVMIEARSMLYKFRQLNKVPCTLRGLLSGPGVWDGGIAPEIECVSHHRTCCVELKKSERATATDEAKKEIDDIDKGVKQTNEDHLPDSKDENVASIDNGADDNSDAIPDPLQKVVKGAVPMIDIVDGETLSIASEASCGEVIGKEESNTSPDQISNTVADSFTSPSSDIPMESFTHTQTSSDLLNTDQPNVSQAPDTVSIGEEVSDALTVEGEMADRISYLTTDDSKSSCDLELDTVLSGVLVDCCSLSSAEIPPSEGNQSQDSRSSGIDLVADNKIAEFSIVGEGIGENFSCGNTTVESKNLKNIVAEDQKEDIMSVNDYANDVAGQSRDEASEEKNSSEINNIDALVDDVTNHTRLEIPDSAIQISLSGDGDKSSDSSKEIPDNAVQIKVLSSDASESELKDPPEVAAVIDRD